MQKVATYLLILAVCWLGDVTVVFGQRTMTGYVVDAEDGKALPGATLRAGDIRGTTSNEKGYFLLRNIPENLRFVEVSYIGYESQRLDLEEKSAEGEWKIALRRSTFAADEVIVSATRATTKSAIAFTNLDADALSKQNVGQDLPILLNFTPSLVSTSDAGAGVGYTGLRIRGTDATRINVTINGIPYNDPESQGVFWVNMPDFASSVSSVQIQRGVGTSTNGAGAFGATVNINTNEFRKDSYLELDNGVGSFGTWRHTVKVGTGLIQNKFTVDARLSKIASDGYIDRARSDLKSYYLSGGYFGKKSFVRINAFSGQEVTYQAWHGTPESRFRNDRPGMLAYIERNGLNERDAQNLLNAGRTYNFYTYDNEVDNYQQDQYQLISSHQLSSNWTLNANAFLVRGRGYFEQYRENDRLRNYKLPAVVVGDRTIERTDLIRRRWLDNYFYGTTFSLDYTSFKKLTANIGGGWNQYSGDHFGEVIWARFASESSIRHRYYFNNGLKTDANLYAKAFYQFTDRLNAFADVQVRHVNYTVLGDDNQRRQHDFAEAFFFVNPKMGVTYQATESSTLYASYSMGNREPNRSDFLEATPDNRPVAETLRNLEAGLRTQRDRWAVGLNYYLMDYKNQLVLTGQVNDVGNEIRINVPRSYRTGLELEGALALNKYLNWNANLTWSQNKIANFTEFVVDYDNGGYRTVEHGRTDISFSPNWIGASQLVYTPTKRLELALLTKYVGRQFLDNTSSASRAIDPYLTQDLRLIWTLKPAWAKEIRLTALLNNVLDRYYASNGYTFGYIAGGAEVRENFYYPQAGRNFLLGLHVAF